MKTLLLIGFWFLSINSEAQTIIQEYTASNGITYHAKDHVQIGVGSNLNGDFQYIAFASQMLFGSLKVITGENVKAYLDASANGQVVDIQKIEEYKGKFYLVVQVNDPTPYLIDIENAIKECEIAYCRNGGAISQEQFEKLIMAQKYCTEGKITKERFYEIRQEIMASVSVEESVDPALAVPEK